jgi:hypothetical protein
VMVLRRPNVAPDAPVATPVTGLRARLLALPRVDAILLSLAAASTALLVWLTMITSRA